MQNQLTPSEEFFTKEYEPLRYFLTPFDPIGNFDYLSDEELVSKFVQIDPNREQILILGRKALKTPPEILGKAIADMVYRSFPGGNAEAYAWFKRMLDLLEKELQKKKNT